MPSNPVTYVPRPLLQCISKWRSLWRLVQLMYLLDAGHPVELPPSHPASAAVSPLSFDSPIWAPTRALQALLRQMTRQMSHADSTTTRYHNLRGFPHLCAGSKWCTPGNMWTMRHLRLVWNNCISIYYIYILVCINVRMLSPTSRIISAHVSILSDVTCFCRELRTSALPLRRVSKYVDAAS